MKIRFLILGAIIFLMLGFAITMFSFETIPYEPPENLPKGMIPITPVIGKTATPIGIYLIIASILVLVGTGFYLLISFLNSRNRK